ncbi:MotA/TolQ/ExbB proton channel family protein [candidate division KSB1 bacterium]|nr:MAG: MotA/TolQ/ExbB proton channel family protein [candidate division KSB1 bacterium]
MSNLWEMFLKGGIMMIPLMITSVIGFAVFIERLFFLQRKKILKPEIVEAVETFKKLEDIEKIVSVMDKKEGPFINILKAALENRGRPREEVKEIITDSGRHEARSLEKGLAVLETIAGISPLMGLLGTVLGMIKVFNVVSQQGLGQTKALSGGISEALVTTVVGLFIAIPALIAYNYFDHKVNDIILEIEKYSAKVIDKISK